MGGQRITEHIMAYREPTIGRTLRRPELRASAGHAYGGASTLFIGCAVRRELAAAMLYPTQHVSCVAVQRDAILGTLAILRTFAAYPQWGRQA